MEKFKYLAAFILVIGTWASAEENRLLASSGTQRVQLLELYSSESCSSCPPADQWASELKDQSGLWKTFVPVVFHVDYWNNLGWKDGFSSESMTGRQVEISRLWTIPNVYTPSFVVDGKEWRGWQDAQDHRLPSRAPSGKIVLSLFRNGRDSYTVRMQGQESNQRYMIRIAVLGLGLETKVTSGENSGRLLKHDFLVLNWKAKSVSGRTSEENFQLKTPEKKAARFAIAAWIEEEGNPTPLQAVGGYLK